MLFRGFEDNNESAPEGLGGCLNRLARKARKKSAEMSPNASKCKRECADFTGISEK